MYESATSTQQRLHFEDFAYFEDKLYNLQRNASGIVWPKGIVLPPDLL